MDTVGGTVGSVGTVSGFVGTVVGIGADSVGAAVDATGWDVTVGSLDIIVNKVGAVLGASVICAGSDGLDVDSPPIWQPQAHANAKTASISVIAFFI